MAKKLKFKLLGMDPVYGENNYRCSICKKEFGEGTLEWHAKSHNKHSYMIDIDLKKEKNK